MSADQIQIRRAFAEDESAVFPLIDRLVEFGPPPWRDPQTMIAVDRRKIAEAMQSVTDDPLVMVAVFDQKVLGFIHVQSLLDYYRQTPHGHISDLVVAPDCEGQGIGRRLIDAARAWAVERGFQWLTLSVFERNRRALVTYEKAGFRRDMLRLVQVLE